MTLERSEVERRYADGVRDPSALMRQRSLAKDYFMCCGEARADGHHEMCAKRPKEPVVHAHQEALIA